MAFQLDSPGGRSWLDHPEPNPVADGAFWLPDIPKLLFVELKSGSIQNAEDQLVATVLAWRGRRPAGCDQPALEAAAVAMSGSVPSDHARIKERFRAATGLRLVIKSGVRRGVRAHGLLHV